jgi:hypothetical protein
MERLFFCLFCFIGLILSACSHSTELTSGYRPENGTYVDYSVFYYIHADSDYLYHGPEGQQIRGNSRVLATAFEVAEQAHSGEVFIYQQRPEKKILGLFPVKSSRLFHYMNGQLRNQVRYRHKDRKQAFLATEAELMFQYRAQNRAENHQNYFLYFGHEIPLEKGSGYHLTLPGIEVNTTAFANGVQNFLLSDEDRFDLVLLSTCNNGTPVMAKLLLPFTKAMLASPQNLHLSHFDSSRMTLLEDEPGISSLQLGHAMAEQTYQRLDTTVHSTITIALYDFMYVRTYIHTLSTLTASPDRSMQFQDNVDCALVAILDPERYRQGVKTWYKPTRFGRQSGHVDHSGWGCKPRAK